MASPIIAVGTVNGTIGGLSNGFPFPFLQKADSAGNYYPHGHKTQFNRSSNGILGIALDASGNSYLGSYLKAYLPSDPYYAYTYGEELITIRKVDPYGNTVWTAHHGQAVLSVCLDDDDNVYIFGNAICADGSLRTGSTQTATTTRKYDNDGNLIWSADHGFAAYFYPGWYNNCQIVFKNGYVYTGSKGYSASYTNLTKYNASTGAVVWKAFPGQDAQIYAIYVDDDDNVYAAGVMYGANYNIENQTHLIKYNSSGTVITQARISSDWAENTAIWYSGIVKNSGDELILSVVNGASGGVVNRWFDKYDLDLTFIGYDGTYDSGGATISRISIDDDDHIYAIMRESRSYGAAYDNLRKFDATTLDEVWKIPLYDNEEIDTYSHGMDVYCLAVRDIEYPPLLLEVDLGIPVINLPSISPPGLPITFSFGIPNIIREYIGRSLPNIYRATLSGTTAYECAISSLNILKNTTSQSLSIVVPFLNSSQITEIESRIGNNIILYRGVKFSSGIEQLESMLSVTFDSVRYDYGANSGSLTLSGSSDLVTGFTKTRAIAGISYRNEINGIRRIRARVDTYLQPGDTADLGGGETLTVAEVTIYINEGSAVMEFTE